MALAIALVASATVGAAVGACSKEFEGVKAEVSDSNIKLDLPPIPKFNAPTAYPDGAHPVAEMRLRGNKFVESEVRVRGYVISIYDCRTAIRTPEMSDADVDAILRDTPDRCNPPNLYLADKPDGTVEGGVWVVDIPRPPREDERKNLPKEDLAAWPAVPNFQLGHQVTVTGMWARQSPKGFIKTDGLLVYASMVDQSEPAPEAPATP